MRRPRHTTAKARTEAARWRSLVRAIMPELMKELMKSAVRSAMVRVLEGEIGRPLTAQELDLLDQSAQRLEVVGK